MFTLPIEAPLEGGPESRVLIIGRSGNVLAEAVRMLRLAGHAAGASNDFAGVVDLFDMTAVDVVVFGGMVPPDTKELLRKQISDRNPAVSFIQGFAGMSGVIAAQVEAAGAGPRPPVSFDPRARSLLLQLDRPQHTRVVAWWGTSFTPPEPLSTSQALLDTVLPAGEHTVAIPAEVPPVASFVVVTVDDAVQVFIVGPMPAGLTPAALQLPPVA